MSGIDMDDIEAMLAEAENDTDLLGDEPEFLETRQTVLVEEDDEPEPEVSDESDTDEDEDEDPAPQRQQGQARAPMMSGHCAWPQTAHPEQSHERCHRMGAGNRAVPKDKHGIKQFAPCPCPCHLGEEYECGNCGGTIRETAYWTGDGEVTYVHIHAVTGRALGEDCA